VSAAPWTEAEIAILREKFASDSAAALCALLPGRTEDAIKARATKLDLRRNRNWTAAEEQMIRRHYPRGGSAAVAPLIPHRTRQQIAVHANSIGVFRSRVA
jgi:hypothetical protein